MRLDVSIQRRVEDANRPFALDVTFASDARRIVLFGPSGAGKSLTLRAIAGLLRPGHGHVRVAGRTLFDAAQGIDLPARERRVGYVFQDYALFPHLTLAQNVAFGLARGLRNPSRRRIADAAMRWMEIFGIDALAARYPNQVSGGEQQRAALARALAPEPPLLLLDEPFAALDADLRGQLRERLLALHAQRPDLQMLVITHDAADAAALGEHVLHLRDGRLVDAAPTR